MWLHHMVPKERGRLGGSGDVRRAQGKLARGREGLASGGLCVEDFPVEFLITHLYGNLSALDPR